MTHLVYRAEREREEPLGCCFDREAQKYKKKTFY
uniref:Uncharacterized protein n=1 Tax=Anguilla anguilla TaxID=7936 RepID=A0A0E9UCU1_ANGAN